MKNTRNTSKIIKIVSSVILATTLASCGGGLTKAEIYDLCRKAGYKNIDTPLAQIAERMTCLADYNDDGVINFSQTSPAPANPSASE